MNFFIDMVMGWSARLSLEVVEILSRICWRLVIADLEIDIRFTKLTSWFYRSPLRNFRKAKASTASSMNE